MEIKIVNTPKELKVNMLGIAIRCRDFVVDCLSSFSIILLFLFQFSSINVSGQITQTYTTSGSFTVPAGVTSVTVECWGGGGGGSSATNAAGGGGGGAYTKAVFTGLVGGNTISYTVGGGGSAGANGTSSTSTFNTTTITANPGQSTSSKTGGSGGAASAIAGVVTASYAGGAGGNAAANSGGSNNEAGGGGGGSALTTANGTAGSNGGNSTTAVTSGGNGTGVGGGGAAADGSPAAVAGSTPGGGGGGRGEGSSTSGVGAKGQVIFTWTCPTYSISSSAASAACQGATSTVTLTGTSSSLPLGTYTVTYGLSAPNLASGLSANATVTTAGTLAFTTSVLATVGSTTVTIASIKSGSGTGCTSIIGSNIIASITVNALPVAPTVTSASICGTGTVTLSATTAAGETIDWYSVATVGSILTSGTGVTSFTTPSITATTTYYAQVRNTTTGCLSAVRTAVTATISTTPAAPTVPIGANVCGSGTATISATAPAGATIDWYSAATGGSILTSGTGVTSFTTPSISTTTTYYAESRNPCISTTRLPVIVTVTPSVTASVSISSSATNNTICSGTSVTFTATPVNGGTPTYQWNLNGTAISGATAATYPTTTLASGVSITVVMTSNASCVAVASVTSNPITTTVNALPTTSISYPLAAYCSNINAIVPATITGLTGGTFSSSPAGLSLLSNGNVNIGTSTPGNYTVTYSFTNGTCSGRDSTGFTITALPPLTCHANMATCNTAGIIDLTGYSSPFGGTYSVDGVVGNSFSPATAGIGTHTITYNYSDGVCSNVTCSFTITVTDAAATISAIPATSYVYSGNNVSIALNSNIPNAQYTWTATANTPSVTGYSSQLTGVAGLITINQQLFNLSATIGQITYTITPLLTGCTSSPTTVVISMPSSTFCESPGTFQKGSCIIDMGVPAQTYGNGLKPYGLLFNLLNRAKIPVYWAINPNKTFETTLPKVDEADFTVDGRIFKGGAFIIPAAYLQQVQSIVDIWVGQGVVVYKTLSAFAPPVYDLLTRVPHVVLDATNGTTIQTGFYQRAGILSTDSIYTLGGVPTTVTDCDDIYVLPHAEPEKWTQLYKDSLLNFINNRGWLYSSCKAVSEVENMAGMNFLSSSGLISDTFHVDGTPPYNYSLGTGIEAAKIASDPFSQSVGTLDDAVDWGAETVYLPKTTWRSTTKIAIYDSNYVNNRITYPNTAAILAYGRAFGIPSKGFVLYLAGHDLARGIEAANVAAARIYGNFILRSGVGTRPAIVPVTNPSIANSGVPITLTVSIPPSTCAIISNEWTSDLNGIFSTQTTTTTFTAPAVDVPTICTVQFKVVDACGRVGLFCTTILINPTITNNYIGSSQTICPGSIPAILTGTVPVAPGGRPFTYQWVMSTTSSSAGFTPATGTNYLQNYSPAALTQITWFRRNVISNGITVSSTSVMIDFSVAPVILTQPSTTGQSICSSSSFAAISVTLSNPSSAIYQWYSNTVASYIGSIQATSPTGSTSSTFNPPSELVTKYYYCSIVNANGCITNSNVSGAFIVIAGMTQPSISPPLPQTACQGALSLTVTAATTAVTYQWYYNTTSSSSGGTIITGANSPVYFPSIIGAYYYYCKVTLTGTSGCAPAYKFSVVSGLITINPIPVLVIASNSASTLLTCTKPSISFSASGGASYLWNNSLGTNSNQTITTPGTYTVTATASNGCTKDSTIIITQNITPPVVGISNNSAVTELTCNTTSISVVATGSDSIYTWNNGFGNNSSLAIIAPGLYTVTATNANGCTKDSSIVITQNITPPTIGINNSSATTVLNCTTLSINLTASTNGASFAWDNGLGSSAAININAPGTYILTATGANGCAKDSGIVISQDIAAPLAGVVNNTATTFLSCTTPSISITATGGTSYLWNNNLGTNPNQIIIDPGTYTVTVKGSNGCTKDSSIIIVNNINSCRWIGAESSYWNEEDNWCGGIPTSTSTVIIPPVDIYHFSPVISAALASVGNISLEPGSRLDLDNQTLKISGTVSSNGNINAINGNIELNGTTAQQSISGSMFTGHRIRNLKISNSNGVILSGTNDSIKLAGVLEFGVGNSTLNANGNLTITSDINGTARIADLTSNNTLLGNKIIGNVTVERYIPNHTKAWQLLSTPTIGQTVNAAWQGSNGPLLNTNNPGYGTIITSNNGSSAAGATALGFDIYTAAGPTMKFYNSLDSSWVGIANTNISIANNKGYMILVRGDRSVTAYNQLPTATTMRTTGLLYQPIGNAPSLVTVAANRFESVGNPYASAIDVSKLQRTGGVQDVYYVWDPKLTTGPSSAYGLGGYRTIVRSGAGYTVIPPGGSYANGNVNIESGQAFFIRSNTIPGTLNFVETVKTSGSAMVTRADEDIVKLSAELSVISAGNAILLDGALNQYDNDYSNNVDDADAVKLLNGSSESISIVRGNKKLVAEQRANVLISDTIFYNMGSLRRLSYQLNFEAENFISAGLRARLIDKYLTTSTVLNPDAGSVISFTVTTDAASYAADRFYVVMDNLSALPVSIKSISANRNSDELVNVNWKVDNETSIEKYEVERSANGRIFETITSALPKVNNGGSAEYNYLDRNAFKTINFYRIKAVSIGGMIQYSNIVKITAMASLPSIKVFPNPVVDKIAYLNFSDVESGSYQVRIYNQIGQQVFNKKLIINAGTEIVTLLLNKAISSGNYKLEVFTPNGTAFTQQILIK